MKMPKRPEDVTPQFIQEFLRENNVNDGEHFEAAMKAIIVGVGFKASIKALADEFGFDEKQAQKVAMARFKKASDDVQERIREAINDRSDDGVCFCPDCIQKGGLTKEEAIKQTTKQDDDNLS